jgi:hypothetical protein
MVTLGPEDSWIDSFKDLVAPEEDTQVVWRDTYFYSYPNSEDGSYMSEEESWLESELDWGSWEEQGEFDTYFEPDIGQNMDWNYYVAPPMWEEPGTGFPDGPVVDPYGPFYED